MGGNFKFQAQDSFLEYFFGRFEKRISLSEKKPPLVPVQQHIFQFCMISDEELAVMKCFLILLLLAIMRHFLLKFDDFFFLSVLVLVMTDQVQATVQQVPIPVSRLPASKMGIWNRVCKI